LFFVMVTTRPSRRSAPTTTTANSTTGKNAATTITEDHFEFGGPIGAAFNIVALPVLIYGLYFLCGPAGYLSISLSPFQLQFPTIQVQWTDFIQFHAFAVYLGWFFFLAVLERILPAKTVQGTVLATGKRLSYKLNGFSSFIVSVAFCILGHYFKLFKLSYIYDHHLALITASLVFCFFLSVYLYVTSFRTGALLARGGNTSSSVYNFFIGRELNPRVGSFDLKYFCELRPGLIGWIVINLGMAAKQLEV